MSKTLIGDNVGQCFNFPGNTILELMKGLS